MSQNQSKSQAKTNQSGKKYLDYEAMGKEDLVRMLKRVHARIKRVSASLREMENEIEELRQLLLYGSSPGASTDYTRGKAYGGRAGYTRGRSYGYRRAGKKPAQVEEEPVEEVEEEVEEEPKPSEEKPAEKPVEKPARKEGGGS
jgi:hypothetical protein